MLAPEFSSLPAPIPRRESPAEAGKRRMRRAMLQAAGLSYRRKTQPLPLSADSQANILLIRPDHLGDLLFLTPALRRLRQALPHARLTLLCGPWAGGIVEHNPDIDEIRICRFPGFARGDQRPPAWQPYRFLYETAAAIRPAGYDAAVILRFDHWWGAWLAAAAGIPVRLGYDQPDVLPFITNAVFYQPGLHEVRQNARLLSALTPQIPEDDLSALIFPLHPADKSWAEDWLSEHGVAPGEEIICCHPGAGAEVKLWQVEGWAWLLAELQRKRVAHIMLTGGEKEKPLCEGILRRSPAKIVSAAGETSLGQMAALQARASLVIGPDCGPLKLAAAAGAPTLELYGPVSPLTFGPWGPPALHRFISLSLACQPCNRLDYTASELPLHYCVRGMAPAEVLKSCLEMLPA